LKLSVIIVNYNVKFFLSQCLTSVKLAMNAVGNDVEVFVVDNHSVDGSCFMIREQFPWVKLIENAENVGFSKANNQAIRQACGEYILLLNPDTVVEENTFAKIIAFMEKTPDAGGLGVRMIDGKGNYLPESKRGLPTPTVAFFKMSGLSRVFKKSPFFNRYHLGYLSENEIHEVDILSGAFMLIRKTVLDKIGLLDETFFMYGEDIDLSYRISQAGYRNYYFPETTIIHYKGESTKKGSVNYVKMFYSAMAIFANKHFKSKQSKWMSFFIHVAIRFRAAVSLLKRIVLYFLLPLLDFIFFYVAFYITTLFWENIKYHGEDSYPPEFAWYVLPMYAFLFVFSLFYLEVYRKCPNWRDIYKGLGLGTLFILSLYALLSENLRYSRAIVIIGTVTVFIVFPVFRFLLGKLSVSLFKVGKPKKKRAVIVGKNDEYKRTKEILQSSALMYETYLWTVPTVNDLTAESTGSIADLNEIIRVHKINEVIFCSNDISPNIIIEQMTTLSDLHVDFKIVGNAIIGSKTVYTDEPAVAVSVNSIAKPVNRRNKRLFDAILSVFLFLFIPVELLVIKNKKQFLKNIIDVFVGNKTWVGYAFPTTVVLPKIKPGVIPIVRTTEKARTDEINLLYAKDYKVTTDIMLVFKHFSDLDS